MNLALQGSDPWLVDFKYALSDIYHYVGIVSESMSGEARGQSSYLDIYPKQLLI